MFFLRNEICFFHDMIKGFEMLVFFLFDFFFHFRIISDDERFDWKLI
jgi:hypothetical protein